MINYLYSFVVSDEWMRREAEFFWVKIFNFSLWEVEMGSFSLVSLKAFALSLNALYLQTSFSHLKSLFPRFCSSMFSQNLNFFLSRFQSSKEKELKTVKERNWSKMSQKSFLSCPPFDLMNLKRCADTRTENCPKISDPALKSRHKRIISQKAKVIFIFSHKNSPKNYFFPY